MVINILGVLIYSAMRVIGGRDDSWRKQFKIPFDNRLWKRIIAPSWLALFCNVSSLIHGSFEWYFLLAFPAFIGCAFMDGYGNDSGKTLREVAQRIFSALASTLGAIVFLSFWLLIAQLILALAVKIAFNFFKIPPFNIGKFHVDSAISEEFVINFTDSVLKPKMAL